MSTRSRIGIKNQDGSIDSIWQHYDGYPSWTGAHLLADYNTAEKARALINQGDREHIDKPIADEEIGASIRHDANEEEFWDRFGDDSEEYAYIWTEEGWTVDGWDASGPLAEDEDAQAGLKDLLEERGSKTQKEEA